MRLRRRFDMFDLTPQALWGRGMPPVRMLPQKIQLPATARLRSGMACLVVESGRCQGVFHKPLDGLLALKRVRAGPGRLSGRRRDATLTRLPPTDMFAIVAAPIEWAK